MDEVRDSTSSICCAVRGASGWRLDDGDIVWISPIGCLTHPNDIDRGGSDGDPYPPFVA